MSAPNTWKVFDLPVFRVFEHGRLRLGDKIDGQVFSLKHFTSLVALAEQTSHRYFTIRHQEIRFKHFVGLLATPFLNLEILPKTDRQAKPTDPKWQGILVDMLRRCHFVRPESPGWSQHSVRSGTLLEWYMQAFFSELESLLRPGLVHHYQRKEANMGMLKGRLQFAQHLKYNSIRKDRFFVSYDHFTNRHPANLTIGAALLRLQRLALPGSLNKQLKEYLDVFPKPDPEWRPPLMQLQALSDRKLDRYEQALTFARHILQSEQADLRSGQYSGLALLFDMNLLFEEYLYRQLLQWKPKGVRVERQQSRRFWGPNRLRPDLVIATSEGRWVLDTKWRLLQHQQPTAEELRQMYVYCDYFEAQQGILVFPKATRKQKSNHRSFYPLPGNATSQRSCRLYFAKVITDKGYLNEELGKNIFDSLFPSS